MAVQALDLAIADGEFLVLVGPSGCGKSTVLRLVAGLETPTQGHIFIGGQDVTDLPPQARDLAMVFQNYALYPHKSVRENLAFGLRMRGASADLIRKRVAEVATILGLESLLDRKPVQLSGGQRQRVALGRAIVREPQAFLLDEPLSNLDVTLRVETRAELARLHRRLGATMLYVTHDQEEAMTLGDRIAVLRDGRLQQAAPPLAVYRRPANVFVGGFIGSPAMNVLPCQVRSEAGRIWLENPAFIVDLPSDQRLSPQTRTVLLGIRPHDIQLTAPHETAMAGRVDVIEPLGNELIVHLEIQGGEKGQKLTAAVSSDTTVAVGDQTGLSFRPDRLHLFDEKSGERIN